MTARRGSTPAHAEDGQAESDAHTRLAPLDGGGLWRVDGDGIVVWRVGRDPAPHPRGPPPHVGTSADAPILIRSLA